MKSIKELLDLRSNILSKIENNKPTRVLVGMATCGIAAGAAPVLETINTELEKNNVKGVEAQMTGCLGVCRLEPMVEVIEPDGKRTTYVRVDEKKAKEIVEKHIIGKKVCSEYTVGAAEGLEKVESIADVDFFKKQTRIALRNCGVINPESIDEYIWKGGYISLAKVLTELKPIDAVETVKKSGLKGRGGAGFPTGTKWEFASKSVNDQKYVCCNADEGDPGAFMDRSVLESDPHSVVEAMAIAGYAIGSNQGYIYVRAEYPVAVKRLNIAIEQAKEYGLLGQDILGTGFNFELEIRLGAGAFVCGEETALMTSIEGKRGEPRPRPPFPAVKGLWQKPTILNNVETFANIPVIFEKGADWFSGIGSEKSKGTKVFAIGGKINNTGLVEVPIGTSLREVIYDIGGGIPKGKKFKAAQTGGPSGGCIPASHIDVAIDYDTLTALGSMMGSGGLIVMDEDNCMVDIAKFFLEFTVDESCGKCPPCRIGTKRMYEILEKITSGRAEQADLDKLEVLTRNIKESSLCGLGQTSPNPVLSTMRYFKDEYEAHVKEKRCPAGVCKGMMKYSIDSALCKSCGICAKNCPTGCITGEKGKAYSIDCDKCVKCGVCFTKCPFKAVTKG